MSKAQDEFLNDLQRALQKRSQASMLRRPVATEGIDFHSNDYLGLARDPELARRAALDLKEMGAGGARLLSGHRTETSRLEQRFAQLAGREAALLFSSGYAANVAVIPALVGEGDVIFSDELNHASLIDGMRLSKAEVVVYPHRSLDALRSGLRNSESKRRLIITESLFSMDGHRADLAALASLAEEEGGLLMVDEAHATGIYGEGGAGLVAEAGVQDAVLLSVHTGGKALGSGGALVTADSVLVDHLTNHCRSFVYSTAPVPMMVQSLHVALDVLTNEPRRMARLHESIDHLSSGLEELGFHDHDQRSPIFPLILGTPERALAVSQLLQESGYAARAVRPPTVPTGTARLRITAHADINADQRTGFLETLNRILKDTACTASS